ncbi:hypothetical protein A0H81_11507 [Grifola frondosa]|uniref:CBM21 domain-containing protein n=1 Tax=Grifola frondosa TaxID=5627 RepID=A0A1C7LWE1_GRIFR|nr:hypothetical protein A0H81_11507 [Grifola frondosa]
MHSQLRTERWGAADIAQPNEGIGVLAATTRKTETGKDLRRLWYLHGGIGYSMERSAAANDLRPIAFDALLDATLPQLLAPAWCQARAGSLLTSAGAQSSSRPSASCNLRTLTFEPICHCNLIRSTTPRTCCVVRHAYEMWRAPWGSKLTRASASTLRKGRNEQDKIVMGDEDTLTHFHVASMLCIPTRHDWTRRDIGQTHNDRASQRAGASVQIVLGRTPTFARAAREPLASDSASLAPSRTHQASQGPSITLRRDLKWEDKPNHGQPLDPPTIHRRCLLPSGIQFVLLSLSHLIGAIHRSHVCTLPPPSASAPITANDIHNAQGPDYNTPSDYAHVHANDLQRPCLRCPTPFLPQTTRRPPPPAPHTPHRRTRSSSTFSDERGPGAFGSLGSLPRSNKKSCLPHQRPRRRHYPRRRSPDILLQPQLWLSILTFQFSPHVHECSQVFLFYCRPSLSHRNPPYPSHATVPFPASSPLSPPEGPSPFFPSASSSKFSSNSSSPIPRTPSTPIILSNGKPLKSSLKSSCSSPNIPNLFTIKHLRAQSAPSTPSGPKNVHFAEKDSGLETVRVFNRSGKPASLSKPSGDDTETETEAESSFPFPSLPSPSTASSHSLVHEIDPSPERTSAIPRTNPSPYANVFLETLALPRTRPPTLRGTVLVRNLSFEKTVAVRFTLDDWQTTSEVLCKHVVSLPGLPPPFPRARTLGDVAADIASGSTTDEKEDFSNPTWDRFRITSTSLLIAHFGSLRGTSQVASASGGTTTTARIIVSWASWHAYAQQRTFSAPSTLKTTPPTGEISLPKQEPSPAAPATRQLSPPPQLAHPRAHKHKQHGTHSPGQGPNLLASPTAAYLSRRLSLSNYVSPTSATTASTPSMSSVCMVTPPTTPPGSGRPRSASLPAEPSSTLETQDAGAADQKVEASKHKREVSGMPATMLEPLSDLTCHGPALPAIIDPPRSHDSSPSASGAASPANRAASPVRVASPPPVSDASTTSTASSSSTSSTSTISSAAGLGLEMGEETPADSNGLGLTNFVNGSGGRVDTNDSSYAAFVRQWCFAQSTPPPPSPSPAISGSPPKSGAAAGQVFGQGTTAGPGHGHTYRFPGFSFGMPDAGMVGGECLVAVFVDLRFFARFGRMLGDVRFVEIRVDLGLVKEGGEEWSDCQLARPTGDSCWTYYAGFVIHLPYAVSALPDPRSTPTVHVDGLCAPCHLWDARCPQDSAVDV